MGIYGCISISLSLPFTCNPRISLRFDQQTRASAPAHPCMLIPDVANGDDDRYQIGNVSNSNLVYPSLTSYFFPQQQAQLPHVPAYLYFHLSPSMSLQRFHSLTKCPPSHLVPSNRAPTPTTMRALLLVIRIPLSFSYADIHIRRPH